MSLPEQTGKGDLQNLLNQGKFVALTIEQINKDLHDVQSTARLSPAWTEDRSALDLLADALLPVLQELSKNGPARLSQFIYRVDLPEEKYAAALSHDPSLKELAFLVIEREAQKVYLRSYFS